jgi:hypothetical protein
MMVMVVAENRQSPKVDADTIELHKQMIDCSGRYAVDGGKVTHNVDVPWNSGLDRCNARSLFQARR